MSKLIHLPRYVERIIIDDDDIAYVAITDESKANLGSDSTYTLIAEPGEFGWKVGYFNNTLGEWAQINGNEYLQGATLDQVASRLHTALQQEAEYADEKIYILASTVYESN